MKKIITLFALFIAIISVAQQAPAPVKVSKATMNKFKTMYPNAVNVDWMMAEEGKYVAHFSENSLNRWITIDEKNNWTNSLFEIQKSDLPAPAIAQIDQWYDNA